MNAWPTRYVGPYRVLDRFRDNYIIRGVYADSHVQTVHANRIKVANLRTDEAYPFKNQVREEMQPEEHSPTPVVTDNLVEEAPQTPNTVANAVNEALPSENEVTPKPRYNLRNRKV